MINILVCGSTGFIGRNITTALASNPEYKVFGTYFKSNPLEDNRVTSLYADLTTREDVDKVTTGIDIIIQAAASTSGVRDIVNKPFIHVTDNAIINSLLLRSAYEKSISKFIFFSCSVMYRSSAEPILEKDFNPNEGIHPKYFGVGWTKVYIEKMCEFYSQLGKTTHTVIRHSNIYGPHDKYDLEKSHVFGATVAKVFQSKKNHVVVWGDGTESRDLLYVDDLVNFVKIAIEKSEEPFNLLNIGFGKFFAVKDLVKLIIDSSGRDLDIFYDNTKPSINTNVCLNSDLAKNNYNWFPRTTLEEGVKKTLEWYKKFI